ncbi:MAG: hypothetical protein SF172_13430 [Burkholderiales bacterium]|nr:hypothetical protein [Burkholderiales bacterium]
MAGIGTLIIGGLFAGYGLTDTPATPIREIGIDRLTRDVKTDRHINTTNVHLFLREKEWEPLNLKLKLGMTVSRATGSIEQLQGSYEEGTLRPVTLDSPGWGIGPMAEARLKLFQAGRLSGSLDATAGVLLYDRKFPAGGDRYNGMGQIGPSLTWRMGEGERGSALTAGWRHMHVSNGQGVNAGNPSYESRGWTLRYAKPL